jgi:hypothetical protein
MTAEVSGTFANGQSVGVGIHGEQWVLETVAGQASKQITYRMECDG